MKASFGFVFVLVLILGIIIPSEVIAAAVPSPELSYIAKISYIIKKIITNVKQFEEVYRKLTE